MNRSKDPQNLSDSTQSGFTIIECLLAIIIVSLLMTAIAPVLAISVATRVQARRVELATAAAKAYIDGVRSGEIQPPPKTISATTILEKVPAPTVGTLTCKDNRAYCKPPGDSLYCINFENQGCSNKSLRAMIIQPFAYTSQSSADPKKGYQLGIRVYRADAFTSGRTLLATGLNKQKVDRTFTGGTGLKTRQAPLIEMTTEIVNDGKEATGFADLCKRVYLTKNPGKKDKDAADACS